MDNSIKNLFLKYINNQCSRHELDEVISLIKGGAHQSEWEAAISEDARHTDRLDQESDMTEAETDRIYKRIENKLFLPEHTGTAGFRMRVVRVWQTVSAAAAVIIITSAVFLFFNNRKGNTNSSSVHIADVRPGGNKAFLTLSNGKKISLTDAAKGNIAVQPGIKISKTAEGQIIYTAQKMPSGMNAEQYNTIETPRGGQYQIRLPDGTAVWLNAASKLIYPVNFRGSRERRVQLEGEAYFEVAGDKAHPFVVKTGRQEVTVLGTQFNINGYKEEAVINTTLLEGRIQTRNLNSGQSRILSPGQQSSVVKGGRDIDVMNVNTDNIISWKNGYFIFNNQDIISVMKVISRWYDVNVEYEAVNTEEKFGGTFSRSSELNDILEVLKKLGKVDFKVKGRIVVVSNQ